MPPSEDDHLYVTMARQLSSTVGFNQVLDLLTIVVDGRYRVLPHLTTVRSEDADIDPTALQLCVRTEKLVLPHCTTLQDSVLMHMPYVAHLTISSLSGLSSNALKHMPQLKDLQILSHTPYLPDTLLTNDVLPYLSESLECLHLFTNQLRDEDFTQLKALRVLVIETSNCDVLTPRLVNNMPWLELFVFNRVLYKYVDVPRNQRVVRRLKDVQQIKIY